MLSIAWVRLGHDPLDIFARHTQSILHENGCQTYPRDSGHSHLIFMHFLGWPIAINETLVQSYTGHIRVAPVHLERTACFARLRTTGAFLLVGEVAYLALTSEAGRLCKLVRPGDGPLRVCHFDSMEQVDVVEQEGVLIFPTAVGATYVVDQPEETWEARPVRRCGAALL